MKVVPLSSHPFSHPISLVAMPGLVPGHSAARLSSAQYFTMGCAANGVPNVPNVSDVVRRMGLGVPEQTLARAVIVEDGGVSKSVSTTINKASMVPVPGQTRSASLNHSEACIVPKEGALNGHTQGKPLSCPPRLVRFGDYRPMTVAQKRMSPVPSELMAPPSKRIKMERAVSPTKSLSKDERIFLEAAAALHSAPKSGVAKVSPSSSPKPQAVTGMMPPPPFALPSRVLHHKAH